MTLKLIIFFNLTHYSSCTHVCFRRYKQTQSHRKPPVKVNPVENPFYSEVGEKPRPSLIVSGPTVKPRPKPKPKPAPRSDENNYDGEPTTTGDYLEVAAVDVSTNPNRAIYLSILPDNISTVGVSSTPSPYERVPPVKPVINEYEQLQSET